MWNRWKKERIMGIIESILFAAGREVTIKELMTVLEAESIDIISIVNEMKENYEKEDRGIQIINVDGAYQLCTKKKKLRLYMPDFLIKELNCSCHSLQWKHFQ